ncbi:MAG: hypothetical protein KQ78_00478 [Candidatus Izimaplasma bacterium HR2]|nr:MAG: hypothetical protein KQ78_00478 [Candidatus Izimaplasma bacterium HR2]
MNEILRNDLKKVPVLLMGFLLLSFGMILTMKSGLGMSSWGVLHQGVSLVSGLTFGTVTLVLGLIILVLSVIFLKSKVGIGTIVNVLLIGVLLDVFKYLITYEPEFYVYQGIMFTIGLLIMTLGRSIYISTKLGPGPRDGIFVGLSRITQIDVKYIKPTVEFSVLLIGFLLGQSMGVNLVGLGTVIAVIFSGYLVQFYFKKLGFNPKIENQRNFKEYLN